MTQEDRKRESKEIVRKFRENEKVHTEEWDETRYLEQKITQALSLAESRGYERAKKDAAFVAHEYIYNDEYNRFPEFAHAIELAIRNLKEPRG
jgi:hypothetical protein